MHRTYKVPMSTYFGLGLLTAGLAFLCLLVPCFVAYPPPSLTKIILVSFGAVAIPVATVWWLSRFKITITPTTLTYSSAYYGEQTVNLSDIESSGIIRQHDIYGSRSLLEVKSRGIKFRINFKMFSHEALEDLFLVVKA